MFKVLRLAPLLMFAAIISAASFVTGATAAPGFSGVVSGLKGNSTSTIHKVHSRYSKKYRSKSKRKRYYKRKYYRGRHNHEHVEAPFTRYKRDYGRIAVDAPFTTVRRSRRGVYVRAPFVNLWIPRY